MAPKIVVLVALYQGADHLGQQLQSFRSQTLPPDHIIASDDGSCDATISIFHEFMKSWPECRSTLLTGPGAGHAANFLNLLSQPLDVDYVALADQDDVWLPDKLDRAQKALSLHDGYPTLYGTRTHVCDVELRPLRLSRRMRPPFNFKHALMQSFAGGNTMVLNRAAFMIASQAAQQVKNVGAHDWWLYQVISGIGGQILYDPHPTLYYRQHPNSVFGDSGNRGGSRARAVLVKQGMYQNWITENIAALDVVNDQLTDEAMASIAALKKLRASPLFKRVSILRSAGFRRHGIRGQLGLYWVAARGLL